MPLVSFLMSNYRTPTAFLRQALDSMLEQTVTDLEVIVINDGVKDASYEMLLTYAAADARIRLIENKKNLGLPASLNKGLSVCRGKYIARMDTDDICYPDRLEKQTAFMEAHPEVMFAGAWADVFSETPEQITQRWRPVMCGREEYRIRLLFSGEPFLIHPTVIFRRSFLEENGLRYSEDPMYRYAEDYEFWTRCADHGAAGILEAPVLYYRASETQNRITVSRADEMSRCVANVQRRLFVRLEIEDLFDPALNYRLLSGRKPFDLRYKRWLSLILQKNAEKQIYDHDLLLRLLHDRWYNIVYYAIAEEKSPFKRLRYLCSLYPDGFPRFVRDLTGRGERKP